MYLRNRVLRLEKLLRRRAIHSQLAHSFERECQTGDHLLRLWENGVDWFRQRVEQVIDKVDGLSPEATASLQERLKVLKTGRSGLVCAFGAIGSKNANRRGRFPNHYQTTPRGSQDSR